jgi:hypothetical protein
MKRKKITAWDLLAQIAPHLGEYRDRLVLIGGLAKQLYLHVDGFDPPVESPSDTKDIDFALNDPLSSPTMGICTTYSSRQGYGMSHRLASIIRRRPVAIFLPILSAPHS